MRDLGVLRVDGLVSGAKITAEATMNANEYVGAGFRFENRENVI